MAEPGSRGSVARFPAGSTGVTPPRNPERRGSFLSDVILELGLADSESVENAVQQSRLPGEQLGDILLDTGALTEEELSRAVAERHGLDYVDLDEFDVELEAASLISPSVASRYDAVPIAFSDDGALIVALEDPVNPLVINDLEVMTKSEVRVAVATPTAIGAAIERLAQTAAPPAGQLEPEAEPEAAPAAQTDEVARPRAEPATRGELEALRAELSRVEGLAREALEAASEARRAAGALNEPRAGTPAGS